MKKNKKNELNYNCVTVQKLVFSNQITAVLYERAKEGGKRNLTTPVDVWAMYLTLRNGDVCGTI